MAGRHDARITKPALQCRAACRMTGQTSEVCKSRCAGRPGSTLNFGWRTLKRMLSSDTDGDPYDVHSDGARTYGLFWWPKCRQL